MPQAPPEDEKPTSEGEEVQEAAEDEPFFQDMDFAIQMTKFDLARLRTAISFIEHAMPGYGIRSTSEAGPEYNESVPASLDLCRRRALMAAYGLVEREFSPRMEADHEDA
ncbi:MAG: hypothetical protein ACXWNW_13700 [Isosphaeraceae bacterium]